MTALLDMRLQDILYAAQRQGASDVHLICGMRAAVRVDGQFSLMAGAPFAHREIETIAATLFSSVQLDHIAAGEDVSTTWTDDERLTIRAHGLRTREGMTVAVRLLRSTIPALDELCLPMAVAGLTRAQRGLIVFGGPTGSGKSTSLAAFVQEMNRTSSRRVMTIEDPIEYRHSSDRSIITQREIGTHAVSYASAVTGALRSDPDVIVIGEMRDSETIRAALTAAETGHLVLTTLHTGDAVQTIDRIVDAFGDGERGPIRGQLAGALHAVVSQRLVPVPDGGRRPVVEVMIATDAIRAMIRDGRSHLIKNAISTARAQGMQTIEQHLAELTQGGDL